MSVGLALTSAAFSWTLASWCAAIWTSNTFGSHCQVGVPRHALPGCFQGHWQVKVPPKRTFEMFPMMGSFTINKQKKTRVASFFALFNINKRKRRASFTKATKRTETKSFVYKTNINKQKQRPSFTKPT